ncbi:MAG: DUF4364 domain-containing protein [Candidatus Bathyarchaeota archaeon]|nr:MAG: DUF4364 domain-containing protein [Candidatus Bathyarchaeota archaeon]
MAQSLYLTPPSKAKTREWYLMAQRNSLEIVAEILSLCKQPQTKTRVLYGTNLSYKMLQKYLSQLQSRGHLEIHHSVTKYVTTRKGLKFLDKWKELQELL